MFENIIGQQKAVSQLQRQVRDGQLPPVLLFNGPPYSGKLSAALELARVLCCEKGAGEWSCSCGSCAKQRTLDHPLTLMAGSRYFVQDIAACAEALKKTPMDATVYLFLRSVQKLLRRFDTLLWQGEETRLSRIMGQLETISEALDGIQPGVPLPSTDQLDRRIGRIIDSAARVVAGSASDNIPIHTIRNIAYWSHLSSGGSHKVVILENAERMHDGSRNAMLKLLEEPPPGLSVVLLTANQAAIPATIRSRVRPYPFSDRGAEETALVLRKIFRETEPRYGSIRQYIMQNGLLSSSGFDTLARQFLELVLADDSEQPEQRLGAIAGELSEAAGRESYRYFFEELCAACRRILLREHGETHNVSLPLSLLEGWSREILRHQRYVESFHMRAELVLQSLWFAMREQHAKVH